MPVSKISSVFPSFYSTNYTLGVPAANIALERSSLGNLTFDISHALCFRKISNISEMPSISLSGPCVVLSNYSLGDFSSNSSGHPCFGLRDIFYPINFKRNVSGLPTPPRPAPLCWKTSHPSDCTYHYLGEIVLQRNHGNWREINIYGGLVTDLPLKTP